MTNAMCECTGSKQPCPELVRLREELDYTTTERDTLKQSLQAQLRELAAAQKDAERYRLLRNGENWPAAFATSHDPEPMRGEDLDEHIDAAMKDGK